MMRQMRESNPQVAAMLENPEMVCTLLLSHVLQSVAISMICHTDFSLSPTIIDESNDEPTNSSSHASTPTKFFRPHTSKWGTCTCRRPRLLQPPRYILSSSSTCQPILLLPFCTSPTTTAAPSSSPRRTLQASTRLSQRNGIH